METDHVFDQLAKALTTDEGLALARALERRIHAQGAPRPRTNSPRPILDWRPGRSGEELIFERSSPARCKPARIRAEHPDTLRICLFGESMAAGFPFAPLLTPSIVLEEKLRAAAPLGKPVEVLDLARPNLGPSELIETIEASCQLRPDILIILAGNNWHYGLSVEPTASPATRVQYSEAAEIYGLTELARRFRSELRERSRTLLRILSDAACSAGARAIVAIPPVNHAWERLQPPPWLGNGDTARWFGAWQGAWEALAKEDFARALDEAARLEALDRETTGMPGWIRSRVSAAQGHWLEARDHARRSIDAQNWQNTTWALPQVPPCVREEILGLASELGYCCLDLENALAEKTGRPYLDFRLFTDQCHLSPEGIELAMSAIAETVLGSPVKEGAALASPATAGTQGLASGFLQSAFWASRYFPARDEDERDLSRILRSHLRMALDCSPALTQGLIALIRLKSLFLSPLFSSHAPEIARYPGLASTLVSRSLDARFLEAVIQELQERGTPGLAEAVEGLLAAHEELLEQGLDLTLPPFRQRPWERTPTASYDPNERQGSPFYESFWPDSRFAFLSQGRQPLFLEVVARSPSAPGLCELELNGEPLGELELGPRWTRLDLELGQVRAGVNHLRIRWPGLKADEEEAIRQAVLRYRLGEDGRLFASFGQLHSLKLHRRANG